MRVKENKAASRIRTQDVATDWSMKGKTVLFTGASRGMGRFAAIELARLGAEILVVGHHEARGEAAVGAIRRTGGSAHFLRADMGDAAEVSALATAVLARTGPVHVLIHSAGSLLPADARTREGVDRGFAQNFLGAFLLTRLLEERRGSQQYVRLAADPALATVSGTYFVSGKEKKEGTSPLSLDPAVQKRIDDAAEAWAAPFLRPIEQLAAHPHGYEGRERAEPGRHPHVHPVHLPDRDAPGRGGGPERRRQRGHLGGRGGGGESVITHDVLGVRGAGVGPAREQWPRWHAG